MRKKNEKNFIWLLYIESNIGGSILSFFVPFAGIPLLAGGVINIIAGVKGGKGKGKQKRKRLKEPRAR